MSNSFEILVYSPAGLGAPDLAVAGSRAGALGVLDLADTPAADCLPALERLLEQLDGRFGLRLGPAQLELLPELLARVGGRPLSLIVCGGAPALNALLPAIAGRADLRLLAEITTAEQLTDLPAGVDGLIARGHEAGGWVGEDGSFLLLQKLHGKTALPVYALGGIGEHSAAACRLAGAAGVVLDDIALLLPESPLPATLKTELARLNGAECRLYGELGGQPFRAYARPASPAAKAAEELQRQLEAESLSAGTQAIASLAGWQDSQRQLLPLGQGIGLAATAAARHGSLAMLIAAVQRASLRQIEQAASQGALAEGAPLALAHGCRYPIAQGPMTRVSDHPGFAAAVAEGGALPFLALALMRGPQLGSLLQASREQAAGRPWGVGLLGFIPEALRQEQCAAIWDCPPPYALIAGGRPDQAAEFESRGIATYIHAPAPALLKLYLEQGARRFVFEGRECGGHVGPLSSFALWGQMIELLLADTPAGAEKDIQVLFAGGIHDALSSAMVAAMAAPLVARGMKIGVLMGTAYLFTEEIVATGAVVPGFQEQALRCKRTVNLESGPGHATRCVATEFARDFQDSRRRLLREGKSMEEVRDALEDLNLGRLRIAAKGLDRGRDGALAPVPAAAQQREGMYMIGQVATLRDRSLSIAELHEAVCRDSQQALAAAIPARAARPKPQPSDVAIVGIGLVLPGADDAEQYWRNLLDQKSVIREVPESRWDWRLYFDENPKARDKIYSRWGGFLDEIRFDPTRFGIPPKSMKSIDPAQILSLEAASRALADAGLGQGGFDRETTSIVLGASGGSGDLGAQYALRAELPRYVESLTPEAWDRLPEWTEESFAGTLLNVAAGRIANRLDFGGINCTVDAACASSLAAIAMAVQELESGNSSLVLAGGFDTTQSAYAFTAFAKTSALSPSGKARTFDQAADGIVISEGVAMVALKRLADAERDGDRIYAVIKAVAGSSDGKALGLTAPRSEGQVRALDRAYAKAGFAPATLGLVEAHGTGTAVGDLAEAQTICMALKRSGATPKSVALGSVKTLLGHTKAAAGTAGLVKVALSLYHRSLPPHYGVEQPIAPLADAAAPVYLLKEPRPWLATPAHPRRGAASAFGFGGTNFHVVLEEHPRSTGAAGASRWPTELFLFRARDAAALAGELSGLQAQLGADSRVPMAELALSLALQAEARGRLPVSLAIVAADRAALARDLGLVLAHLKDGKPLPNSLRLQLATPASAPAIAFLFPGQGAQQLNMGREAALYFEEVRQALEFAERALQRELPQGLAPLMMPPAAYDEATETAQSHALTDTRVAQPAIGALSLGYLRLAERLGLRAIASAGHSYGEYSALMAAGVIAPDDFLHLSAARGAAMAATASAGTPGGMAAVQARREQVSARLADFPGVVVANHNAPEQCVISGPKAALEAAVAALNDQGLRAMPLAVSGAFHTALVAPAKTALAAAIQATPFRAARFAVYSNSNARPYPAEPAAMQEQLDAHLLSSVEFVAEIEAMQAAGCQLFVELGPRGICANMARQTLAGRADAQALSLDGNGGGLRGLLLGLAELFVAGADWRPSALYSGRGLQALSSAQLAALAQPLPSPAHLWMVSGGCARPINDPVVRTGAQPALTLASREAARAAPPAVAPASASPAATTPVSMALPAAAQGALSSEALLAYQQTMRQFLSLQERVMQQALGAGALPSIPAAPQVAAPAMTAGIPAEPATPAPPPPQSAAAAAAPAINAQALLLSLVAERTGYPTEMLGLDADLEADLGIDSIKRVEILGAFRKAHAGAASLPMEKLSKAKTLKTILAALPAEAPAATMSEPAPTTVAASEASTSVDAQALLLALVAERTGYPTEMLGLDADLEADLGIDSIKRVEILGAFRKVHTGAASLPMEKLSKAKSLRAILAALPAVTTATGPTTPTRPASREAPAGTSSAPTGGQPLPRYLIRSRPAPLDERSVALVGLALILGSGALANGLRDRLAARGLHAVTIDSLEPATLRAAIAAARQSHGPLRTLIHLHGLTAGKTGLSAEAAEQQVLHLFHSLQEVDGDLAAARVLVASRLGGSFGRDRAGLAHAVAGAGNGLLNCLRYEFPQAVLRAVDFGEQSDTYIAERLVAELFADNRDPEAGYLGETRVRGATLSAPLGATATPRLEPGADWLVLATGGARGITAELLEAMARPGMRLVLVGRSPLPEPEAPELAPHAEPAALKAHLLRSALARGEQPRPADIERVLQKLLTEREIRANLARLAATGATLEYCACDARDEASFGALIERLYTQHGRIDAVLHAAGVIEDKRLADKSADSFARVLGTKLAPAFTLRDKLRPESLKLMAFFTSVAGRYGNLGQGDYAAANESLNRLAWQLHRHWPATRVIAFNWGPWDAGMASEAVKAQLRARGMEPIPLAEGRRYFLDELRHGAHDAVEVVAGRGTWGLDALPPELDPAGHGINTATRWPLLPGTPALGEGGQVNLQLPFPAQPGLPPLASALELLAQFVCAAWPQWTLSELADARLLRAPQPGQAVLLRARAASHSEPGVQAVSLELLDAGSRELLIRVGALLRPGGTALTAPLLDASSLRDAGERQPVRVARLQRGLGQAMLAALAEDIVWQPEDAGVRSRSTQASGELQ